MASDPSPVVWSGLGMGAMMIVGVIALALTVFWVWMLVEVLIREQDSTTKIVWVIVIVFLGWLGALIYLLARRSARIRELGG